MTTSWWVLALRGAAAVIFGILALIWPGLTLLFLVALFAAYAIVGGAAALVGAIKNRGVERQWWLVLLWGIVALAAGALAIIWPGITALALVLLMGANALVNGVLEIILAVRLRRHVTGEWLLGAAGALSILFGLFVLVFPGPGALALVWLIAAHAIAIGILLLAAGFSLRRHGERPFEGTPRHA
jgi:uncharacterized membrane protein HdeD (DUF308 family)